MNAVTANLIALDPPDWNYKTVTQPQPLSLPSSGNAAGVADPLRYRSTVLIDVSPDARQVVLIATGPDAAQDLLDAGRGETTLTAAPRPTLLRVIERYAGAGIEHIFLGYDHIAFLAAVVLWARRLWPVVKVVTAFTIAHSITLSLAALDIVRIPSTIVEPAIAASIVSFPFYCVKQNDAATTTRVGSADPRRARPSQPTCVR
jgi:hypothetical protein